MLLSVPETIDCLQLMKRLWVHEILRTYYDRLVWDKERAEFFEYLREVSATKLEVSFDDLFDNLRNRDGTVTETEVRNLLFCDFCEEEAEGMAKSEQEKCYKEVGDVETLRSVSESLLEKYNGVSRKPMDLVLFNYALEHLSRIARVLKQPESHMLVIGVGGSGRQSLSRLATHIAEYEFHEIELSKVRSTFN